MLGKIIEIIVSFTGYDATVLMDYGEIGTIYCSVVLDTEECPGKSCSTIEAYFDDSPVTKLVVGSVINTDIKVIYGNDLVVSQCDEKGYIQNISKSPETNFTGKVIEIIDAKTIKCDFGSMLSEIVVELIKPIKSIQVNDIIHFSGEFALGLKVISNS